MRKTVLRCYNKFKISFFLVSQVYDQISHHNWAKYFLFTICQLERQRDTEVDITELVDGTFQNSDININLSNVRVFATQNFYEHDRLSAVRFTLRCLLR